MKVFVKTLKGTKFEINVEPEDTVADVKKNIETVQGADVYPAAQQMLIQEGEVLKDMTTLEENKVAENSFIVIMLRKAKLSLSGSSTKSTVPSSPAQPSGSSPPPQPEQVLDQAIASTAAILPSALESPPLVAPTHPPGPSPASVPVSSSETEVYGQAASNLVAGSILEGTIQQIIDMGGGSWDRDTVMRALRAAYNNPERAVEYLYLGIPEQPEVALVVQAPAGEQIANSQIPAPRTTLPSSGPNANPLDLFPQGVPNLGSNANAGNLDFLRNSQQFQALRAMVQANPQILQPILQELAKQNPQLLRHIEEHHADFLRLINEPVEGEENSIGELTGSVPQAVTFTPEEREAIGRLEAMGFDRDLVLEAFFACNKNEELAANYLLDHMHEFDD